LQNAASFFPPYRSGQVGERLNSTLDANQL